MNCNRIIITTFVFLSFLLNGDAQKGWSWGVQGQYTNFVRTNVLPLSTYINLERLQYSIDVTDPAYGIGLNLNKEVFERGPLVFGLSSSVGVGRTKLALVSSELRMNPQPGQSLSIDAGAELFYAQWALSGFVEFFDRYTLSVGYDQFMLFDRSFDGPNGERSYNVCEEMNPHPWYMPGLKIGLDVRIYMGVSLFYDYSRFNGALFRYRYLSDGFEDKSCSDCWTQEVRLHSMGMKYTFLR
jgi:hypothetical protein